MANMVIFKANFMGDLFEITLKANGLYDFHQYSEINELVDHETFTNLQEAVNYVNGKIQCWAADIDYGRIEPAAAVFGQ
jgi:hypothetical protein